MKKLIFSFIFMIVLGCGLEFQEPQERTQFENPSLDSIASLVPAYLYYNSSRKDYFTAISNQEITDANNSSYILQRIDYCIISSGASNPVSLYLYWSDYYSDNVSALNSFKVSLIYQIRFQGYLEKEGKEELIPLYLYYDLNNSEYFSSVQDYPDLELKEVLGYVYPASACSK